MSQSTPRLFPYQQEGAAFLAGRTNAYLGDHPGLGKSAQAITAADKAGAERVLVLAPASLKVNWAREFAKFSTETRPVIYPDAKTEELPLRGPCLCIINYDIVWKKKLFGILQETVFDAMIGDEWHRCKNPEAKVTRAILGDKGVFRNAGRRWLLSGTPAPNHPGELYPTLLRMHPKATLGKDYYEWLEHYCVVENGPYGPRVRGNKPNIYQLREHLQEFMIRRKADVLDPPLPPLWTSTLTVENDQALTFMTKYRLNHEQELIPDPAVRALVGDMDVPDEVLEDLDDVALSTLRRYTGTAKAYPLADMIADELEDGKEKIVLMCWHKDTMDILQKLLRKYGVARVDGDTKDPTKEVDRFQGNGYSTKCRVFIGQILAAGTGHTLTAAHDMIIVEPSWVPGENVQAMLRILRIGQTHPCNVRFAALANSIDESIMRSAERKARAIAEIM